MTGGEDALAAAAVRAWHGLGGVPVGPKGVEVLKSDSGGAGVCRLRGAGDREGDVIAKRSPQATAAVERVVYEEILPQVPLPLLRYYGAAEEPERGFCWIFLEDVTVGSYRRRRDDHRAGAGRWLGVLHRSLGRPPAADRLPSRRSQHYRNLLRSAGAALHQQLAEDAVPGHDAVVLEAVLEHCEGLATSWDEFEQVCRGVPDTLVHGDFIGHNVYVRRGSSGLVLLPIDWEKAGWGVPAEDISGVDLDVYWTTVKESRAEMDQLQLRRLATVGRIFRCLVYLDWAMPRLERKEGSVGEIALCRSWLDQLVERAAWLS